ncbi:MAG: uridine kinase [Bacteroidota bacterium]
MKDQKPYIVGICGGSGSGKTYLLNRILAALPQSEITLISQDNYYKSYDEQIKDEEGLVNFDHPDSINLLDLKQDLRRLLAGETVDIMEYTFNNPAATAKQIRMLPSRLMILEGLFIYYLPEMRELIDLKIYIKAEEHVRLARRLRRDHEERGYSHDSVLRDYERFVAPMYHRFVAPTQQFCDLIVPNNTVIDKSVEVITDHLTQVLRT